MDSNDPLAHKRRRCRKKGTGEEVIYELQDTSKAEALFSGMEDSLVLSCLEKEMGKVFVTDPENPRSAMTYLAEFSTFAGEPDRALVKEKYKGFVVMVPPNAAWERLILDCFPAAERDTRYAIRKDTAFDRQKLQAIAAALPEGYELKRIDGTLYDLCRADEDFEENVMHFDSKEDFLARGRGFAVLKDGKLVSAASSYTVYREGIEVQIATAESERRKGLASAACAKLILSCLDDGLYPSWDAASMDSVRLAEKLGYTFSHPYTVYCVGAVYDDAIENPDRSNWANCVGRYEQNVADFHLGEIFLRDGELYGTVFDRPDGDLTFRLIPVGNNTFGRNGGALRVTFGDDCLVIDGIACKKINDSNCV